MHFKAVTVVCNVYVSLKDWGFLPDENRNCSYCCCTGSVSKCCLICFCTCDFQSFCWCCLALLQIELLLCVSHSLHFTNACVLKLGVITLSNTYQGKKTITCKLISGTSGMTDRPSEKRNCLCRVTYFFFPQFCHQSWRLNLLNSLFVQRLLYCEWKSYCLDRLQRNDRNGSNNTHFVHSFHLLKIHFAPCNILGLLRDTWEVISVEKKAFFYNNNIVVALKGFCTIFSHY